MVLRSVGGSLERCGIVNDKESLEVHRTLHEVQDQLEIAEEQIRKLKAELAASELRCAEALEQALARREGLISRALSSAKRALPS
jgi:hypothetical protein